MVRRAEIKSRAKLMGEAGCKSGKGAKGKGRGETFVGGRLARDRGWRSLRRRTRGMRKRGRNGVGNAGEKNGGGGCGDAQRSDAEEG